MMITRRTLVAAGHHRWPLDPAEKGEGINVLRRVISGSGGRGMASSLIATLAEMMQSAVAFKALGLQQYGHSITLEN